MNMTFNLFYKPGLLYLKVIKYNGLFSFTELMPRLENRPIQFIVLEIYEKNTFYLYKYRGEHAF
jgi:hypothetical protein